MINSADIVDRVQSYWATLTRTLHLSDVPTEALAATGILAIVISVYLWKSLGVPDSKRSRQRRRKKLGKKKKTDQGNDGKFKEAPVPMTLENQIENIWLRYKNEFEKRIEGLLTSFDAGDEKQVYERNYCNEMLLKLLIELDGVDLVNLEPERKQVLRNRRKDIIKIIQGKLNALDKLK